MNARIRFAIACGTLALMTGLPGGMTWAAGPLPATGIAQPVPDWEGKIEDVNSANNSIIVNDRVFLLQSGTVFHGNRSGRSGLYKGMTVRIKSTLGPGGVPIATEIWTQ